MRLANLLRPMGWIGFSLMATAANASGYVPVEQIQALNLDGSYLYISAASAPNIDSCGHTGVLLLPKSDPNFEYLLSMLLTAQAGGSAVTFWSNGCATNFKGEFANVTSVTVYQ